MVLTIIYQSATYGKSDNQHEERDELDKALYRLQACDQIDFSTLQEARVYTLEQVEAEITQNMGSLLLFITVIRNFSTHPYSTTSSLLHTTSMANIHEIIRCEVYLSDLVVIKPI